MIILFADINLMLNYYTLKKRLKIRGFNIKSIFFFFNLSITLIIAKIHSKMCIKKLITHWSITWNLKNLISFKNTIPMIIQYFSFPHWFPRNSGIPGIWIFSKELPKFLEFIQTGFWISCTIYSSLGLRWWCSSLFSI